MGKNRGYDDRACTRSSFLTSKLAFCRMRKFMTTPVPFPLIQMTRTIVLVYVFAIPFVLLSDPSPKMMIEHCLVVFFLTFGYVNKFAFCEWFTVSSNLTFCCIQFHGPRTRFDWVGWSFRKGRQRLWVSTISENQHDRKRLSCPSHPNLLVVYSYLLTFSCLAYARMVFEDTFLQIHETDGMEWADIVRFRMQERSPPTSKNDDATEATELLHETIAV